MIKTVRVHLRLIYMNELDRMVNETFPNEPLIRSILEYGLVSPVIVRRITARTERNNAYPYDLVDGRIRCWAIAKIARRGLVVPCDPNWNPLSPTVEAFIAKRNLFTHARYT